MTIGNTLLTIMLLANVTASADDYFRSAPAQTSPAAARPAAAMARTSMEADMDLALAAMRDDVTAAQDAIRRGANVNCTDCATGRNTGKTPLMLAVQYAGERPQNNMVRLLLRHGANPNGKTAEGLTALHYAALAGLSPHSGAVDAVMELLTAGADPKAGSEAGITPIFWWASAAISPRQNLYPQQREEIYRDFLAIANAFGARGANLAQREKIDGNTPLHFAAELCNPHGVLLMQALGIDAATGNSKLLMAREIVERKIQNEGETRQCRQTIEALNNKDLARYWRQIAIQTRPIQ